MDDTPQTPPEPPVKRRGPGRPRGPNYERNLARRLSIRASLEAKKAAGIEAPNLEQVISLFGESEGTSNGTVPESGQRNDGGKPPIDTRNDGTLKVRFGKRWTEIIRAVENKEYTWEEFCGNLTSAELARGQLMDVNGSFTGRPPQFVPRAFFNACQKELLRQGAQMWKENYVDAIQAMTDIAKDKTAKEGDRIKAATFVIERLEGKVPMQIAVTVDDPWQIALEGMIAEVNEDQAISRAHSYSTRTDALEGMMNPNEE
jgi:hypothetical protein